MKITKDSVLNLFNSGRFKEAIRVFESAEEITMDLWPMWIGSLIFLGQTEKAFALYNQHTETKPLSPSQMIACRFYLILGAVRTSQYALAKKLIIQNLRCRDKSPHSLDIFYSAQGLAFYRFFCGRFSLSKKYARVAFDNAVKNRFLFGEMISTDLLGHSLVHLGFVREGLKYLDGALGLAIRHKNQWLIGAIQITIAKFRAQHGIQPDQDLKRLEDALAAQSPTDTYSRAELLLELNRQYVLRGYFSRAETLIAEASELAYKHQNKRQIATLNLRMSYMLFLQKNYTQALHILRFAEQSIQPDIDRGLFLQLQGLKASIFRASERSEEFRKTLQSLEQESLKSQNCINRRILHRSKNADDGSHSVGEDPLGDLIDATHRKEPKALQTILEHNYYGLFHKYFNLPFSSKVILVDLVPGSIVLMNSGNVLYKESELNSLLRKLLLLCRREPQSKESLVQKIWGYEYDPLRHDSLIYSSTNKLRKVLEPYSAWFQLTESGYRVRSDVKVLFRNSTKDISPTTPREKIDPVAMKHLQSLNFRQIQVIDYLKKNQTISIGELSLNMSISKPTATRDLSQLHQLDIVVRVGQGRATRYLLKSDEGINL
ncbi:MAG: DeoR family transcriptional regulator [Bdellovibrionales bacterium]|nr:DeoR family transcriptional regulator [Bdellovibrionales bacterium]